MRNSGIEDILSDSNFFIEENKGVLVSKRNHHEGHFTNCQLQMGLCGASFSDIVVFVFNGMIIMRIYFKKDAFLEVIHKINSFYKKFLLPKLAMDFKVEKGITKV